MYKVATSSQGLGLLLVWLVLAIACGDAAEQPAGSTVENTAEHAPEPRPIRGTGAPVILIVVDTLRADHLSHNGYPRATSPRLDDWAKRAALFERTYATAPWTLPSFGSILTGMSPLSHEAGLILPEQAGDARHEDAAGMRVGGKDIFYARLDAGAATLAELLDEAGYATGAVVNNPFLHARFGLSRGFADYDHEGGSDFEIRRADVMVDRAIAWIDANGEHPFFLMLQIFDPHMNYDPPADVKGRFTSEIVSDFTLPIMGTPPIRRKAPWLEEKDKRFITAAYDEEVAFVDRELGRLLRELEKRGLTGNGLILLTADHGEELFDHDAFGHGHTMFEEQLRVPLLVWGRGVSPARIDVPVSIMDVGPTILDALELEVPVAMEGASLWPTIHRGAPAPTRPIVSERRGELPEHKTIVQWPYKLTIDAEGRAPALFDLAADPGETREISAERPELVAALSQVLLARFEREAGHETVERAEVDEETAERLRALGYMD